MKKPLMLSLNRIPPAQAEALYDDAAAGGVSTRWPTISAAEWPGEDWDDDTPTDHARPDSAGIAQHWPSSAKSSR